MPITLCYKTWVFSLQNNEKQGLKIMLLGEGYSEAYVICALIKKGGSSVVAGSSAIRELKRGQDFPSPHLHCIANSKSFSVLCFQQCRTRKNPIIISLFKTLKSFL